MIDTNHSDLLKQTPGLNPDGWGGKIFFGVFGVILGALSQYIYALLVRWYARRKMRVDKQDANFPTCDVRVVNGSAVHLKDCWAYISLKYEKQDKGIPPEHKDTPQPHIKADSSVELKEDRLAWSLDCGGKHEPKSDICPGERLALTILSWHEAFPTHFSIASEIGHSKPRIYLRKGRKYEGVLKIVSASINAKAFAITIDPDNTTSPITIGDELNI